MNTKTYLAVIEFSFVSLNGYRISYEYKECREPRVYSKVCVSMHVCACVCLLV